MTDPLKSKQFIDRVFGEHNWMTLPADNSDEARLRAESLRIDFSPEHSYASMDLPDKDKKVLVRYLKLNTSECGCLEKIMLKIVDFFRKIIGKSTLKASCGVLREFLYKRTIEEIVYIRDSYNLEDEERDLGAEVKEFNEFLNHNPQAEKLRKDLQQAFNGIEKYYFKCYLKDLLSCIDNDTMEEQIEELELYEKNSSDEYVNKEYSDQSIINLASPHDTCVRIGEISDSIMLQRNEEDNSLLLDYPYQS